MRRQPVYLLLATEPLAGSVAQLLEDLGFEVRRDADGGGGIVVLAPDEPMVELPAGSWVIGPEDGPGPTHARVPYEASTLVGAVVALEQVLPQEGVLEELRRTISHDVRSPIAVVSGYCEILRSGVRGALLPAQEEAVAQIEAQLKRLLGDLERVERELRGLYAKL